MICQDCRRCADNGEHGIEAHAEAGCKDAQEKLATLEHTRERPYEATFFPIRNEEYTHCACQHRAETLPNLERLEPAMREKFQ